MRPHTAILGMFRILLILGVVIISYQMKPEVFVPIKPPAQAVSLSTAQEIKFLTEQQILEQSSQFLDQTYEYNSSRIINYGTHYPTTLLKRFNFSNFFNFNWTESSLSNSIYDIKYGDFNGDENLDISIATINRTLPSKGYRCFLIYIFLDVLDRPNNFTFSPDSADVVILGPNNVSFIPYIKPSSDQTVNGSECADFNKYAYDVGDFNGDSYSDLVFVIFQNAAIKSPGAHSYPEYRNVSISVVYGKRSLSPKIECNISRPGTHPDLIYTNVPDSSHGYTIKLLDLNNDNRDEIVYTYKAINYTNPKNSYFGVKIINGSGEHGIIDSRAIRSTTLFAQATNLTSIVSFAERYSPKIIACEFDNKTGTDLIIKDLSQDFNTNVWCVYNISSYDGVYNLDDIADFTISLKDTDYTDLFVSEINDDGVDDIILYEYPPRNLLIHLTNPDNPYSGGVSINRGFKVYNEDPLYQIYGLGASQNYDVDFDGYKDLIIYNHDLTGAGDRILFTKLPLNKGTLLKGEISYKNISCYHFYPPLPPAPPNTPFSIHSSLFKFHLSPFEYNGSKVAFIFANVLNTTFFNQPPYPIQYKAQNQTLTFFTVDNPPNTPPQITNVKISPTKVRRGECVTIQLNISDNQSSIVDMQYLIEIYNNSSNGWMGIENVQIDYAVPNTVFITKYFPLSAPLGLFNLRMKVYDPSGFSTVDYCYVSNAFEVLDNPPEVHSVSYEDKTTYRDNSRYQITFHVRDLEDDYNLIKGVAQYSIDGGPWSDALLQIQRLMGAPDTFTVTLTLYKSIPAGSYSFSLAAIDKDNVSSPWFYLNDTLFVRNYQPVIDSLDIKPTRIYRGESSIISISGSDNEHDNSMLTCILQYSTTPTSNVWVNLPTSYNLSSDSWQATFSTDKNTNPDQYYFRAALLDPDGGNSTWFSPVKYLEVRNNPPVLNESIELYANTTSLYLNLKEHGWDYEDSDNLSWYVYSYPTIGGIIKTAELIDNYTLRILFNENVSGDVEVKLKAEDSDGDSSSMSILIHVNTISPYVKIYGRITISGAPQGVTPEDFTIIVYDPAKDQTILSLTTDQNGRFEAYGVPRGRIFNIKILPPENLTYVEHVRSGFEPDEVKGIQFLEDFHLEREMRWKETYIPPTLYTITITVKDEEGEPVASARLRINETEVVNYTSSSGITTFSELTEGTYHLYIEAEGFYSTTITLNVPDQLNYTVTLKRVPPKTPHQPESRLPLYAGIAAAAVIIILMLLFLMKKKRGEEKEEEKTEEIKEEESLYSYEREEEVKPETPPEIPEEAAELSYKPPEEYS